MQNGFIHRVWGTFANATVRRRGEAERAELESRRRLDERLESLGMLAGGVAHEFNNALMAICCNTELAMADLAKNPTEALESLRTILKAAEHAARLTRRLTMAGRHEHLTMEQCELDGLVDSVIPMARGMISPDVSLTFNPKAPGAIVDVDRGHLEQIILNLCMNASEASSPGSALSVQTRCARPPPGLDASLRYVAVEVRDRGRGIEDQYLEQMFDPFYTTKQTGSGLGLTTVHSIVRRHGGTVSVCSEMGVGTLFTVYLPVVRFDACAKARPPVPHSSGETILLAEDEDRVRVAMSRTLTRNGYRVLACSDGLEAVETYARHAAEIDVVMLDAVMPNLNGFEVYNAIVAAYPSARFLFCSGHSHEVFPHDFFAEGGHTMLLKPFSAERALGCLQKLLTESPPQMK